MFLGRERLARSLPVLDRDVTRTVLADTGPLCAPIDPDDQYQARAQQLQVFAEQGLSVLVADPILPETYTNFRDQLGAGSAAA